MGETSTIEWTDATWNPITGCSIASPGCAGCYAMKLAGTPAPQPPSRAGLTKKTKVGPVWTGEVRFNADWLTQPLTWLRPRMVFVCAHGDLFHEDVPDAWIDQVFAVMALAPHHTFQVLTKRAERMRMYLSGPGRISQICDHVMALLDRKLGNPHAPAKLPLPNVWLGVSAERQKEADERIPHVLATPAAVRFVSIEPMIEPIDLEAAWRGESALDSECWGDCAWCVKGHPPLHNCRELYPLGGGVGARGTEPSLYEGKNTSGLDWVIVGGESGDRARPMHPDWARSLRDQCADANVPFFFKQWGEWAPGECNGGPQTRTERVADWHGGSGGITAR